MEIKLISYTANPEKHIEYCGRISRDSQDKITKDSYERFDKNLMNRKHLSVLRHSFATFEITEVSRSLTAQFRTSNHVQFTEMSMRYVKVRGSGKVVIPQTVIDRGYKERFEKKVKELFRFYNTMANDGVPIEDARYILPIGTKTKIIATANFQGWLNFLKERIPKSAQWEIREMAKEIQRQLIEIAPVVFDNLKKKKIIEEPKKNLPYYFDRD